MLNLSKNQIKVIQNLGEDIWKSVTDISKESRLPRSTVDLNLRKFVNEGFVISKKIKLKNRHVYKRKKYSDIEKLFFKNKKQFFGEEKIKMNYISSGYFFFVYKGKKQLIDALNKMLNRNQYERVYGLQDEKAFDNWINVIGEKEVNSLNLLVKEKKIIMQSLRGKIPEHIKLKKEIIDAYRGRLSDSRFIDSKHLEKNVSVYIFSKSILIIDTAQIIGYEIENELFTNVFRKLFLYAHNNSTKLYSE